MFHSPLSRALSSCTRCRRRAGDRRRWRLYSAPTPTAGRPFPLFPFLRRRRACTPNAAAAPRCDGTARPPSPRQPALAPKSAPRRPADALAARGAREVGNKTALLGGPPRSPHLHARRTQASLRRALGVKRCRKRPARPPAGRRRPAFLSVAQVKTRHEGDPRRSPPPSATAARLVSDVASSNHTRTHAHTPPLPAHRLGSAVGGVPAQPSAHPFGTAQGWGRGGAGAAARAR